MTQPQTELKACIVCGSDNVEISVLAIEVRCHSCMTEIRFYVPEGTESQTKHAIIRKYNALPRSSPQVAPRLRDAWNAFEEKAIASNGYFDLYVNRWPEYDVLRDAIAAAQAQSSAQPSLRDVIRLAIAEDDPEHYWNMYRDDADQPHAGLSDQSIDRCADIAYATVVNQQYDTAAAQGGQVVDRDDDEACKDAIGLNVRDERERCWWIVRNHPSRVNAHVQSVLKDIMAKIDRNTNDCTYSVREVAPANSAVPSAPGTERVKAAFKALHQELGTASIEDFGRLRTTGWTVYSELGAAVDALGQPQGSDSLSYTTELPSVPGWYWRRQERCKGKVTYVNKNWGNGDMYISDPVKNLVRHPDIEFAGPITEPAQPVAAGEAKERGE